MALAMASPSSGDEPPSSLFYCGVDEPSRGLAALFTFPKPLDSERRNTAVIRLLRCAHSFVTSPARLPPCMVGTDITSKAAKTSARCALESGLQTDCSYLWRPDFAKAIDILSSDLICYHVDDEYSFSAEEHPISEQETHLLTRADQVFIHSPALLEKKGQMNRNTAFVPNGVDYEHYSKRLPEPADIASLPHPRIGYSGRIKRQLDWVLVRELVARHPQWFFVFVGAINPHPEVASYIHDLTRRPNIRFLGSKSTQELAAYPQYFDVCIMPYIRDDYTKYIYPLKLHEYLATGRPVVSTPIPSLQEFSDVVLLPQNAEEWSSAIAESLSPAANLPNQEIKRQKIARGHDWEILVRRIAEIISTRLGPEVSRRLNQSSGVEESRAIRKS